MWCVGEQSWKANNYKALTDCEKGWCVLLFWVVKEMLQAEGLLGSDPGPSSPQAKDQRRGGPLLWCRSSKLQNNSASCDFLKFSRDFFCSPCAEEKVLGVCSAECECMYSASAEILSSFGPTAAAEACVEKAPQPSGQTAPALSFCSPPGLQAAHRDLSKQNTTKPKNQTSRPNPPYNAYFYPKWLFPLGQDLELQYI